MEIQLTGKIYAIDPVTEGVSQSGTTYKVTTIYIESGYDCYAVSFFNDRIERAAGFQLGQTVTMSCYLKGRRYFNNAKQRNAVALSLNGTAIVLAQPAPQEQATAPAPQPYGMPQQDPQGYQQPPQQYTSANTMPPHAPIYQGNPSPQNTPINGGGLW